jgi:hypothetical protein
VDTTRPIANPVAVLRQESEERAILFNPDTGDAVAVNRIGLAVWRLLAGSLPADGERTVEQLLADIARRFAGVPDGAADEVSAFIDDLAERGLVGYEL